MRNKELISGRQLTLLTFTYIIATGTLFVPSIVADKAGQDGWLSVLIGGLAGVITALIVTNLGLRYPSKSLIEYSEAISGKFLGKIIGIIFMIFFLHFTSIMIREITSTIHGTLLHTTNIEIITFIIFLATAYSVKMGLETITRANTLNLIVTFIAIFIVFILLIKDMNPENLTPVLSKGISPALKGALSPAGWFCEIVSISFVMPYLNKPKEARLCSIIGVVWAAVTLSFMASLVIMIFGPELSSVLTFPTLQAVRYINIGQYVQHIEIIFLIPWIVSNYIKISFFYYVSVLIISDFFKIKEIKTLVIPVGLFIYSLSLTLFKNGVELTSFLTKTWGGYSLPIELGIPLLLFIIEIIRKKGNKKIEQKL